MQYDITLGLCQYIRIMQYDITLTAGYNIYRYTHVIISIRN